MEDHRSGSRLILHDRCHVTTFTSMMIGTLYRAFYYATRTAGRVRRRMR